MIIIETPRLTLRNWRDSDRALFHEINCDPEVMAFFPALRSRAESDALMDKHHDLIADDGFGFYAMEERSSGEVLGFTGLAKTNIEPFIAKDTLEIGWRLARRFWGKGYVQEAAKAALAYAFVERNKDEVVSFAVHDNHRSTAVMERLGMTHLPDRDFDHPGVPEATQHLKHHVLYQITKTDWLRNQSASIPA